MFKRASTHDGVTETAKGIEDRKLGQLPVLQGNDILLLNSGSCDGEDDQGKSKGDGLEELHCGWRLVVSVCLIGRKECDDDEKSLREKEKQEFSSRLSTLYAFLSPGRFFTFRGLAL